MEALTQALQEIREQYGDDAVRLQSLLFTNTLKSGPVTTVEVGVDGVGGYAGRTYLGFRIETGIIFNTITYDEDARLRSLWSQIVAPSLARLQTLKLPPDGIKIDLGYNHRPYSSESQLRDTIEDRGKKERAVIYLSWEDIVGLLAGDLNEQELLDHSSVTVNGTLRHLSLDRSESGSPFH